MELVGCCEVVHTGKEKLTQGQGASRARGLPTPLAQQYSTRWGGNPELAVRSGADADGIGDHLCAKRISGYNR